MKKGGSDKDKALNKAIEMASQYLLDTQNAGGCFCGRVDCPLNWALYLLEQCQIPIEIVARIFAPY